MNLGSLIHASDNIIASVLYLLICFVTTMWLLVIYHSKTRTKTVRGTFFNIILYTIILLLVSNFLIVVFLNAGIDGWLFRVVYAIHWGSFIWWFGTYRNYNLLFLSGDGEVDWSRTSMKDLFTKFSISKRLLWNTVFQVLALVIYFFLPFKMLDVNNLNFIDGIGVYFVIAYMFIVGGISLYETVFVYKDESLFNKLSVVFVFLVMLVAIACQYIVKDTIVYCICAAIQVFFLYFMVENPDIKLRKDIEKMKIGIEKSNKAKTDFLSNMSHEIRTPMNAIVGFSDSLLNNKNFDVKTARADIENIYTAGNNLVDIINNILDISKIESEQGTLSNKNCSIDKIVKELASVVKARLGKKPVEFITELDEHIPSVIWGDSTKIYQVLLNIANNSVKYTEVGKIKLSCIPETLDNKQSLLHFKISDTGYGIKKEDFDKVFKQYSRLDDATSNDIEGTGLGLVITKQFVELMGGKIWFTSDFEVGTTFYIDIPVKVIDDTPIGVQKDISTDKTEDGYIRHLDCSDYTVLIVDDNETNLKVASVLLEKYNFKIETAKNGKDCIYKFKYGNHYDMILLDDMMPEMDGVSTVKIIKKLDVFDIPPIVAFTANAMTGMGEKYLDAGFDYYLPMPVSVQELDELVKTYFGEKVKTYVEDREGFIAEEKENIKSTKDDHIEDNNDNVKEEVREEKPVEESHDEKSEKEEENSEEKTNDDSKEEVKEEKPVEESHDEKSEKVEETSEEKTNDDSKEEVKEEKTVEESQDEKSEKEEETSEEKTNDDSKEEVKEEKPVEESQDENSEKVEESSEENTSNNEESSKDEGNKEETSEEKTSDEEKEEVKEEKPVEESHDEKSEKEEESSEENTSNNEESSKDEGNKEETSEEKTSDEEKEEVKEEKPVEESHDEKSEKVEETSEENTSNSEESSKNEVNKEETSEENTSNSEESSKNEVNKEETSEEKPVEESHDEKSEKVEETSEENTSNSEESSKEEGNKEDTSEEKTSDDEVKEKVDENSSGDVTADQEKFLRDKGIDMDKALEFLMDMEMYNLTICDFLAAVDEKWDRIKKYKDDEDMSNYAVEVHSLKSDCKYLGFMKLADVSYEHELKSKEDNLEFVKENFDRLEKEYNDALAIMKEYVQKYNIKGE